MRRVVIYARSGSDRNSKWSNTTAMQPQLKLLHRAARQLRFEVIGEFREEIMHQEMDFPMLTNAIDFASANHADLMILRPDRLGLNLEALNLRLKYLRKKGVLIWFANGQALDAATVTKFDTATMEEIQQRKKKYQDMVSANQAGQKKWRASQVKK
jgi:DNA invertase Pin-like site-specific DNA recombinase